MLQHLKAMLTADAAYAMPGKLRREPRTLREPMLTLVASVSFGKNVLG